tara:strand:+ start:115 stop:390 length:276 start_codon:yes stop_codon:yes gene_type:complete
MEVKDPRTPEQKTAITIEYLSRFVYWVNRLSTAEMELLEAETLKLRQLDDGSEATKDFLLAAHIYVNLSILESVDITDDKIAAQYSRDMHR